MRHILMAGLSTFFPTVLTQAKLTWVLSTVIALPPASLFLRQSLPRLALSVARLPMFSPAIFLPPVILAEGGTSLSTQLLDQALSEVEILQVSHHAQTNTHMRL